MIIFTFSLRLQQFLYMIFSCQEYLCNLYNICVQQQQFFYCYRDGWPERRKYVVKKTKLQVFKMMIRNFIINIEINKASRKMLLLLFFFYLQLITSQPQQEDCKQYRIMKTCQHCPQGMHEYSGNCIYNLPNCITHSLQNPFVCSECSVGCFLNHDKHCQEQKKSGEEYPIFPYTKYTQMNLEDNFTVFLFRKIEQIMEQTANGIFYQVNTIFFYQSIISSGERYMRLTSQEQSGCLDQIYRLKISNANLQHQELIYQYHLIVDRQFQEIIYENDSSMELLHRYKQSNPPEFRGTYLLSIYKKPNDEQFIFILFDPNDKVFQVKKTNFQLNLDIAQFAPQNQKTLANLSTTEQISQEDKQSIYNMVISTKSWEYLKNFTINSFKKYLVLSKDQKQNQIRVYHYSIILTNFEKDTQIDVPVKFKKTQIKKEGVLNNYSITYLGDELPTTKLSLTLYCDRAKQVSLNSTWEKFQFQKNSTELMNISIYTSIIQLIRCSCLDNLFNQTQFSLRDLLVAYTNNRQYYYISYNRLEIYPYGPFIKHFIIQYDKKLQYMKLYSQYETASLKAPNTRSQFHVQMRIDVQLKDKKEQSRILSQILAQKEIILKKMRQDRLYSRNSRIKSYSNSSLTYKKQNGLSAQIQCVQIQLMYLPSPGIKEYQFPFYKNITFRYAYFNNVVSHLGYFVTRNYNYSQIPLLQNELNEQTPKNRYRVCIEALIQIIKSKNITKDIGEWSLVRYYHVNKTKRFLLVTKFIFPIGLQKYVYYELEVSNKSENILAASDTPRDNSSIKDNQNKANEDSKKMGQDLQYSITQTEAGHVDDGTFGGLNIFAIRKIHQYYNPVGKQKYIPTEQDLQNAIQGADKKIYVSYPISKDYTTINLIDELNTSCQDQVNHIYFNNTSYSVSPVPMGIVFSDPRFIRIREAIQLVYKNVSDYYLFYMRRVPTVTLLFKNNTKTYDKVFNSLLLQFQMVYINFSEQHKFVGLRIMAGYKWKSGQIMFSQFSQIPIQQNRYREMYDANQKQIIESNSTYPKNVRSNYHVHKLYQENRKKLFFNGQYGINAQLINSYECNEKYKDIVKLFEAISKASIFSKQVTSISVNYPFLIIYHNSYSYNFSILDNLPIVKAIPKPSHLSITQAIKSLMRKAVAQYLCIDPQHIGKFNIGSKSSVMGIYDTVTVQLTIKTQDQWQIFRQEIIERFTFEVISQKNEYLNLKQLPLLKVKQREIRSYGICEQINLNLTKKIVQEPYLIPIQYTSSKFYQKQYLVGEPEQKKSDLSLKIYQKNLTERCKRYSFYGNFPTFQNKKLQKQIEEMNEKEEKYNAEKTKYFLSQRQSEATQLFLKGNMITKLMFTNEGFYSRGENYRNLSFPGIKQYIHPYLNQILNLYLDKSSKKTQQSQINLVYWKLKQYSQHLFLIELFYDTPSNYIIRMEIIARKPRKSETQIIYPVVEKLVVIQLEFIKKKANLNLLQQQQALDIQNVIKEIKSWKQFQIAEASLKSRYGMYFDSNSKIMNIKSAEKGNELYFDVQYKTISGYFDAYLGYSRNNNSGRVIFFNVGKNQTFYNQTRNCKQYDSSNKCKKCHERYFLYQNKCYPQFEGCLKQVSGICVYCRPEYKITSSYRCQ